MKSGKAVGPDDIPVEVWKCLEEVAVGFLTRLFNRILESDKMPDEWGEKCSDTNLQVGCCAELYQLQRYKVDERHNEDLGKSSL